MAMRCFCPPESADGIAVTARSARPTRARSSVRLRIRLRLRHELRLHGRERDIAAHGHVREQVEVLEHHAHLAAHAASIFTFGSVDLRTRQRVMVPAVGCSSRFRQRRNVDLPEPEGPMMTTFSPGLTCSEMSSSTRWSPNDLDRCLTSITLTQPPFKHTEQLGKQHDQQQVHQRDAEQREQALIRLGNDRLGRIRHLLTADDGDEGRILEQGNELVAEGRQNVLDGLRDDDKAHGREIVQAQTAGRPPSGRGRPT